MKKLFILVALIFTAGNIFSQNLQEKDIPEVVKSQFKTKFPQQTMPKWELDDSLYQASFTSDEMKVETNFDATGNWKETEWEIPLKYTPSKIKEYVAANYAGYKTEEVLITDKPIEGKMYLVEICKKKETVELVFTTTGEFKNVLKAGCEKEKKKCEPAKCPHHQTNN